MRSLKYALWVFASLIVAVLACSPGDFTQVAQSGDITIVISSPANNAEVPVGQPVNVQLTIVDPAGIVTQEQLELNGAVVANETISTPPGQTTLSVSMSFTPNEAGTQTMTATAYGSDGSSATASLTLVVVAEEGDAQEEDDAEAASASPEASPEPMEESVPVPDEAQGCTNDMDYVADVSIPDGTEMDPGETFTKTWTIRNAGTCDWGGYQLVFASDEQMGGPSAVTVPATNAGANVNVSVNLTAPDPPGTHYSRWTMRAPDGTLFGNVIYAKIEVVEPAPPEEPAPEPGPTCGDGNVDPGEACDSGGCGTGFVCTDECTCESTLVIVPGVLSALNLNYTAGFAGLWNCGTQRRVNLHINNTGTLPIESMRLVLEGPPGTYVNGGNQNTPFRNTPTQPSPQCMQAGEASLAVGDSRWVNMHTTTPPPGGTPGRALLKLCGLDDLGGFCKETTIDFTW